METSPETLAQSVHDRESFLAFLDALVEDWNQSARMEAQSPSAPYGAAALGWENVSVGHFLESARAWASDAPSQFPASASWHAFAQLFLAGKVYE